MGLKITQYPNSITTLQATDLTDWSEDLGAGSWESKKMAWSDFLTNINNQASFVSTNLYTADGTLAGNRTVTLSGNNLDFAGVGNVSVGVGVGLATAKLHINGNGRIDGSLALNNVAPILSILQVKGTNDAATDYIARFDSATVGDRVVFRNDGNVGINVTSPTAKLHIKGSSDLEADKTLSVDSLTYNFFNLRNNTWLGYNGISSHTVSNQSIGANFSYQYTGANGSVDTVGTIISNLTAGSYGSVTTSAIIGNVSGFNSNTLAGVKGVADLSGASQGARGLWGVVSASNWNLAIGVSGRVTVSGTGSSDVQGGYFSAQSTVNATNTIYGLYATSSGSSLVTGTFVAGYFKAFNGTNNYAIITDGGNSGFNIIAPTAMLHIKGASSPSDYALKVDNSSSSPLLYVRNDGRTIIGGTNPSAQLEVKNTSDGIYSFRVTNGDALAGDGILMVGKHSGKWEVNIGANLNTRNSSDAALFINKANTRGSISGAQISWNAGGGGYWGIGQDMSGLVASSYDMFVQNNTSVFTWGYGTDAGTTPYAVLTNTGLGVGISIPTAKAHISGSSTAAASLRIESGTAPTTPNNGDIWFDGTDLKMRVGGVTKTFTLV